MVQTSKSNKRVCTVSPLWPASQPPGFLPHRHLIPLVLGVLPGMFQMGISKLAYFCLLVHLCVSPHFYINDSIIWTAPQVLSKHFYAVKISFTQSRNNHYKRFCVSPGSSVYVLYCKKNPQINYYKYPHITSFSVLLLKRALCFSVIYNVCSVFNWVAILEFFFFNLSLVTGSMSVL